MNTKRLLTGLLAGVLAMSLLAGCGEDSPESSAGELSKVTTTATTTAKTTTTTQADVTTTTTGTGTTTARGEVSSDDTTTNRVTPTTQTPVAEKGETYDLNTFTQSMFTGNTVYYDSVCFAEDKSGKISDGVLMYTPTKILSVYSTDLKTKYEEGRDFTVKGNTLVRTENSRIPVFRYAQYCQPATGNAANGWIRIVASDRELILGNDVMACQVFVTYTHNGTWSGTKVTSQLSHLPNTAAKLKNKQDFKLVLLGDSITAGYDASGLNDMVILNHDQADNGQVGQALINRAPYMPSWADMLTAKLKQTYGNSKIVKVNRGAGGSGTYWGKIGADKFVNPENPDLVLIGFGMNQPSTSKDEFKADINTIIDTIHAKNPNAEFLLFSCMMPNTDTVFFKKHKLAQHEEALYEIQSERTDVGVGVVPVHSVFADLMANGKKYVDFTSNNINHPNDYACRVYAQCMLAALEG